MKRKFWSGALAAVLAASMVLSGCGAKKETPAASAVSVIGHTPRSR